MGSTLLPCPACGILRSGPSYRCVCYVDPGNGPESIPSSAAWCANGPAGIAEWHPAGYPEMGAWCHCEPWIGTCECPCHFEMDRDPDDSDWQDTIAILTADYPDDEARRQIARDWPLPVSDTCRADNPFSGWICGQPSVPGTQWCKLHGMSRDYRPAGRCACGRVIPSGAIDCGWLDCSATLGHDAFRVTLSEYLGPDGYPDCWAPTCHPDDVLVVYDGEQAIVRCWDCALAHLGHPTVIEGIPIFRTGPGAWSQIEPGDGRICVRCRRTIGS